MKYSLKIIILLLVFTSCKSKKNVAGVKNIPNISTRNLITNHYKNPLDKKTVDARLGAKYKDKYTTVSLSIKLRMEKDKAIWMSATKMGIPIAKLLITPAKVRYYEKLENTYFDGDFSLLSKWLGTELDYEKVQNLLLGQAVLNLKKGRFESDIVDNSYLLQPKRQSELFDILFFINAENFKLDKQKVEQLEKEQQLTVLYSSYQEIEGEIIPKNIEISSVNNKGAANIKIDYRSVAFDKKLSFPFKIPSGYKEIELKK